VIEARIRIGNQTFFSTSSITEPFRYAVVNRFDAFEWFPDLKDSSAGWTECDLRKRSRALIRKIARDHDMAMSVHVPWTANPLKEKSHDVIFRNAELALDIGASLVNIHFFAEQGIDAYAQAISPLIEFLAGTTGIRLSIENVPATGPAAFNSLFEHLHKLWPQKTSHVGMCLDLGHANLCKDTLNDYLKYVDLLSPQVPIIHVHMHENYGDHDSHMTIFTGPAGKDPSGITGLLARLKKRCFSGAIIMEQWPEPPSLLNEARNRLLEMLKVDHAESRLDLRQQMDEN
jgi:sugar phosphate isomerase/epimerase